MIYDTHEGIYIDGLRGMRMGIDDCYSNDRVIRVTEGSHVYFYSNEEGLVADEDYGLQRASVLKKTDAVKIADELRKQHPTSKIELLPYHKQ